VNDQGLSPNVSFVDQLGSVVCLLISEDSTSEFQTSQGVNQSAFIQYTIKMHYMEYTVCRFVIVIINNILFVPQYKTKQHHKLQINLDSAEYRLKCRKMEK